MDQHRHGRGQVDLDDVTRQRCRDPDETAAAAGEVVDEEALPADAAT